MAPHQRQPPAQAGNPNCEQQTEEFRAFSASIHRQLVNRINNNYQERRANRQGVLPSAAGPSDVDRNEHNTAPRQKNRPGRLHDNYQHILGWPVLTSNVREQPPRNPLPIRTPAPPGPSEPNFVFADEREVYLAKCPPNVDFSKIVFMPNARPSGNATHPIPTNTTNPTPPGRLLSPTEEADIQSLFLAKCRAARRQAKFQRRTQNSNQQHEDKHDTSTPGYLSSNTHSKPPIPHCDPDDASTPKHYAACEVCRGIRRRAVPDDHAYWTKGNMEEVPVVRTKPPQPPLSYMTLRASTNKMDAKRTSG